LKLIIVASFASDSRRRASQPLRKSSTIFLHQTKRIDAFSETEHALRLVMHSVLCEAEASYAFG